MQIIKRNGSLEPYEREKIVTAIRKSFVSTGEEVTAETLSAITREVEHFLAQHAEKRSVEHIQDEVERSLMEHGFYAAAKSYILYRWQRTEKRNELNRLVESVGVTPRWLSF